MNLVFLYKALFALATILITIVFPYFDLVNLNNSSSNFLTIDDSYYDSGYGDVSGGELYTFKHLFQNVPEWKRQKTVNGILVRSKGKIKYFIEGEEHIPNVNYYSSILYPSLLGFKFNKGFDTYKPIMIAYWFIDFIKINGINNLIFVLLFTTYFWNKDLGVSETV